MSYTWTDCPPKWMPMCACQMCERDTLSQSSPFFFILTHNKVLSRTEFLNLLLQNPAMHIKYLISGISHFTLSTLKRACAVQFFTFSHAQRTRSVKLLEKKDFSPVTVIVFSVVSADLLLFLEFHWTRWATVLLSGEREPVFLVLSIWKQMSLKINKFKSDVELNQGEWIQTARSYSSVQCSSTEAQLWVDI